MGSIGNALLLDRKLLPGFSQFLSNPLPYVLAILLIIFLIFSLQDSSRAHLPIANPKKPLEWSSARVRNEFSRNGRQIINKFIKEFKGNAFQVNSEFGLLTILPHKFIPEIRNDTRLSFSRFMAKHTMSSYPGFEAFSEAAQESSIMKEVVKLNLTKSLEKVNEPLSEETALALGQIFTDQKDWHAMPLKPTVLAIVARISSRIFMGTELCRDPSWLRISAEYSITAVGAVHQMRRWHPALRPVVYWFLPSCRKLREQVKEGSKIVDTILEKRRGNRDRARAAGIKPAEYYDAIEWLEEQANGKPYDPAVAQIVLSFVSLHTTTDLLTQVLFDLAEHPELIEQLRKEIIDVLGESLSGVASEGRWKNPSLNNLKLLDSVIKETQRLKPIGIVSLRRVATDHIQLSDGTRLPKGSSLVVSAAQHWDSSVYQDPERYDGYRFLRMRAQPGIKNAVNASLTSTSPEHLGFGHGLHRCPGRFFASNEMKIALCHILIKYDFRIPKGEQPRVREGGIFLYSDPVAKLEVRRRKEEIVL